MSSDPTLTPAADESRYIFVCYSHADQEVVDAEINRLQGMGFAVWWDARIQAGAEWSDELASRIQGCEWFLFFASPKSVQSQHCRNELNYAQQHERHMIAVELEPHELPAGLQLMLNARQFLFRHQLPEAEFHRRLAEALSSSRDRNSALTTQKTPKRKGKGLRRGMLAASLITLLVVVGVAVTTLQQKTADTLQFIERDAVVVGNLDNRTDDPQLGEALESSLRIALAQSQFASIIPEATIRAAKLRMGRDPSAPLDRGAAVELARREDARASVVGSITQLGGAFTISVEVLDPVSGTTVWPGSVRANSRDELLGAIDELSRRVREQLGESLSSIQASSLPLAKVTTPDLEALRLYSLAEESVAAGDWETGMNLLGRALEIDPEFAMAHGKMAAISIAWARRPAMAVIHYDMALQNASRLSPREQAYIEASSAWLKKPVDMRQGWKSMTVMFPNEAVGFNNLGEVFRRYFLDYPAAEVEYRAASQLRAPWQYLAIYNLAQSQLALGRTDEALQTFTRSFELDANPVDFGLADTFIVLNRHDEAMSFIDSADPTNSAQLNRTAQFARLRVLADRGEIDRALLLNERMLANAGSEDVRARVLAARVALLEGAGGEAFAAALSKALADEMGAFAELALGTSVMPTLTRLAILARIALRSGLPELAAGAVAAARERLADNGFPVDQAWLELLEAEVSLQQGEALMALEHAQRSLEHAELFQAHESLVRIHALLDQPVARLRELSWMEERRGLAFSEDVDWFYARLFNILDWSRAAAALKSRG